MDKQGTESDKGSQPQQFQDDRSEFRELRVWRIEKHEIELSGAAPEVLEDFPVLEFSCLRGEVCASGDVGKVNL